MHTETKAVTAGEIAREATEGPARDMDRDYDEAYVARVKSELAEYDLPELAETMEEADARAASSSYLFAMRNIQRELDANDAEFDKLQTFNRQRHVARQKGLIAQKGYLSGAIKKLFSFMTLTGKKKSLNLLGGCVGTRGKPDELVVDDDDEVIVWAQENGLDDDLVRTKLAVDRKALRTYMDERRTSRELREVDAPPGVTLEERDDEFYATPATD